MMSDVTVMNLNKTNIGLKLTLANALRIEAIDLNKTNIGLKSNS